MDDNRVNSLPPDGRCGHFSRINTFQNASNSVTNHHQRVPSPFLHQKSPDRHNFYQQNVGEHRSYSPFQAYQNHIQMQQPIPRERREYSPVPQRHFNKDSFYNSPIAQRKYCESPSSMSPLLQRRTEDNGSRWSPAGGSPLAIRNHIHDEQHQSYNYENTSPILLQRFYHQKKQQQQAKEAEEAAKNDSSKI